MVTFKCKMCGGQLEIQENQSICTCDFCGTTQTVHAFDDEKKINYFRRADSLRYDCQFDKAAGIYETLVVEFPNEAEAYWGLVLCKYGIEYVDDFKTGLKIPTCHRTQPISIYEDNDFKNCIKHADVVARSVYEKEAKKIEELQKSILKISAKEEPIDIFICYKETNSKGDRTPDSVLAQDIYKELVSEGYRVFFSRITLEDKLGSQYEPYVFAALHSSKIMLHVTTSRENSESTWVRNEWSRYLLLIQQGQKKTLIPCYKNISACDLPSEMQNLQGQDMSKLGAMQDLIRGIKKIINCNTIIKQENELYVSDKLEKERQLERDYQSAINELNNLDSFCSFASDVKPIIDFFKDIIDYKESKKYLKEAKLYFIRKVNSFADCITALDYLEDFISDGNYNELNSFVFSQKTKFRTKELQYKNYAPPVINILDVDTFCDVSNSLIACKRQNMKNFNEFDSQIINDCFLIASENINASCIEIAKKERNKNKLKQLLDEIVLLKNEEIKLDNFAATVSIINDALQNIESKEKQQQTKGKMKKILTFSVIGAAIAIVIGIITGLVAYDNWKYSPDRFSISLTNKTQEYKSDVSPYVNGCYYIYFDFSISNSSDVGCDSITIITDISCKSGGSIGKLKSSFYSMDLHAKSTSNYQTYLEDNQPEINNNKFFVSIYNASYSELTFNFTVTSIGFSDGHYYLLDNY